MIRIFRSLKSDLVQEGKVSKYLLYAFGEILLVVIGILIALQIDNLNDARKQRALEVRYLENIKVDLTVTIDLLDQFIANQSTGILYANRILEHSEGRPVTNVDSLNMQCIALYSWRHFNQSNNTFQEMTNSGNLALLSNDTIKNMLLTLESAYELLKSEEDHFRYDAEELLYTPLYAMVDLNPRVDNFTWLVSGGQAGKNSTLSKEEFVKFLKDVKVKNGFVMAKMELGMMNSMMTSIKAKSQKLVHTISRELKR